MRTRSVLSALAGAALVAAALTAAPAASAATEDTPEGITAFTPGEHRLAGADRYATALAAASRYKADVDAVFIATGENFPDALSASAAAANLDGPLLLTPADELPEAVREEIERLQPDDIYVAGGAGAVSAAVFDELTELGADLDDPAEVTRLGGDTRYATSLAVVDEVFDKSALAIIATGTTFPDALVASAAAGANAAPVILVDGRAASVDAATLNTLRGLGVTSVSIAGGTGAVSEGIVGSLRSAGISVARYGGADRYATAAAVNGAFFAPGATDTVFMATGLNFPDALSGAALAGALSSPLFITTPDCVPEVVHDRIDAFDPDIRVIMGGTAVVSAAAAKNTACGEESDTDDETDAGDGDGALNELTGIITAGDPCPPPLKDWFGTTADGTRLQCKANPPADTTLRWRTP